MDIKAIDRPNYSICKQNPNEIFVNVMFELLGVYERLKIALATKDYITCVRHIYLKLENEQKEIERLDKTEAE